MPKTKEQKQKEIEILEENLKNQKSLVLLDYSGINSSVLFDLRNKLKNENCRLRITKKTLLVKTLDKLGEKGLLEKIKEVKAQLALVFGFGEAVVPVKLCWKTARENENLKLLGSLIDNQFLDETKTAEIASLPSRQELLAKLACGLASPLAGLNSVLRANLRSFLYVLSQRSDKISK